MSDELPPGLAEAAETLRTQFPVSSRDVPRFTARDVETAMAAERARADAELESLREQNAALSDALGEAEATIVSLREMGHRLAEIEERTWP